jgi:hypothetical protein
MLLLLGDKSPNFRISNFPSPQSPCLHILVRANLHPTTQNHPGREEPLTVSVFGPPPRTRTVRARGSGVCAGM